MNVSKPVARLIPTIAMLVSLVALGFMQGAVAPSDSYEPDDSWSQAKLITSGTSQTHSISPMGDADWMRFILGSTLDVTVEITDCSGDDTMMYLYQSDGSTEITHDDDSGVGLCSMIQRQSMASGTYYVAVTEFNSNSEIPSYTILVTATAPPQPDSYEPDGIFSQAKEIVQGVPQVHSIAPLGDRDWVKFTLSAKTNVTIETSGSVGDTVLYLFESDGSTVVAFDDDSGVGLFSRINRSSLDAGTYYVMVEEGSSSALTASYTLRLWTGIKASASPGTDIGLILLAVLIPVILIIVLVVVVKAVKSMPKAPKRPAQPYYPPAQQAYAPQYWPQQYPQAPPQQGPPQQNPPPQQGPPIQ